MNSKRRTTVEQENSRYVEAEAEESGNNPGLFGEIETNLETIKHILGSNELKGNEKVKTLFLERLRNSNNGGETLEITSICEPVNWQWRELYSFISQLYSRTERNLHFVTRKLTYMNVFSKTSPDDNQQLRLRILEKYVKEFEELFGCDQDLEFWRRLLQKMKTSKSQMNFLRQMLAIGITNSFGWLICRGNYYEPTLRKYRDILNEMEKVGGKSEFIVQDKISYLSVCFGMVFRKMDFENRLKLDSVEDFARELVIDNVDFPEPYFFFLLLFWPEKDVVPTEEDISLLQKCMYKLREYEDTFTDTQRRSGFYFGKKSTPIFFLKERNINGSKLSRLISTKDFQRWNQPNNAAWLHGRYDKNTNVVIDFGPERRLTIRSASLHYRGKRGAPGVKFVVGFTFGGAVAFGLDGDSVEAETDRLRNVI